MSDSRAPLLELPPPRRFDLLGVGECSLDRWLRLAALPAPGGKADVAEWGERPGGQVATAVLTATRLGLRTAYAGAVGDDPEAEAALAPLRAAGVDLSQVQGVEGARTRSAVIVVEAERGERIVLGQRDPRLRVSNEALAGLALDEVRVLLLDASEPELALQLAERARRLGRPVVLDLDTPSTQAERLLACVDFPIVSEAFAEQAYGSAEAALARMQALGARFPVVTRGGKGAMARLGDELLSSPALEVVVVDSTGAGDVFHGAFVCGLLRGLGARELLRCANAAGAFACTGLGAQGAIPDTAELEAWLAGASRA